MFRQTNWHYYYPINCASHLHISNGLKLLEHHKNVLRTRTYLSNYLRFHLMYAILNHNEMLSSESRRPLKHDSLNHLQYSILTSLSGDRVVINNCVAAFHALVLVEIPLLGAKKYDEFCGSPSNLTQNTSNIYLIISRLFAAFYLTRIFASLLQFVAL
jgi:hypothetical protein